MDQGKLIRQARSRPPRSSTESTLVLRNLTLSGRRTSVRLEPFFWHAVADIAGREGITVNELCAEIAQAPGASSLTSAIRVFALRYFRAAATEHGHVLAGHGAWRGNAAAGLRRPGLLQNSA